MYDIPENTLYCILQNPLFHKLSIANMTCKEIYEQYKKFDKKGQMPTPEEDALLFYLSNHGFHLIRNKYSEFDELDDKAHKVIQNHIKYTNEISKRLFFYIILISIEEAHFLPKQQPHFYTYMESMFGKEFVDFMAKNTLDFSKLDMPIGKFLQGVRAYFDFAKWGPGFGGKPWGNITGIAQSAVVGRQSFEMMSDYAFTLCHNNGSMFNKGKLYSMYSNIYEILDIQASGQIPNWINENLNKSKHINSKTKETFNNLKELFPKEMTAPIDKKKLDSGAKARREKHEKEMNQMKAAVNATWNMGNQNQNNQPAPPPPKKIDTMLIDTYKGNKWI